MGKAKNENSGFLKKSRAVTDCMNGSSNNVELMISMWCRINQENFIVSYSMPGTKVKCMRII